MRELDFHEFLEKAESESDTEEHISVTCDGCGAKNDLQPNVTAGLYPFCNSPLIAQHVSEKRLKPESRLAEKREPWDLHNLRPYQPEYLSGFKVESYTIGIEEGFTEAGNRREPIIKKTIRRDIGGDEQRINTMQTSYSNVTFKHILLPVWISAYHYRDNTYRFLINANTGEVQGKRLYSVIKITLLAILISALTIGTYLLLNSRQ